MYHEQIAKTVEQLNDCFSMKVFAQRASHIPVPSGQIVIGDPMYLLASGASADVGEMLVKEAGPRSSREEQDGMSRNGLLFAPMAGGAMACPVTVFREALTGEVIQVILHVSLRSLTEDFEVIGEIGELA